MKKYLLLIGAGIFILPFTSQAQTGFSFGVIGGPVLSSVAVDNVWFGDNSAFKSKLGGTGGLQVLYGFGESGKIGVNLGAGFTSKGWKVEQVNMASVLETKVGGLGYIDIPLNVRYLFDMGLFLETGPTFSFLMGAHFDGKSSIGEGEAKVEIKDFYNSTDLGWGGGVGYVHEKGFGALIKYTVGMTNIASDEITGSDPNTEATMVNGLASLNFFYLLGYTD